MEKLANVWLFSENANNLRDLLAAGFELGDRVSAVLIGNQEQAAEAVSAGADTVYLLEEKKDRILEDYFPSLQKLIRQEQPQALLLKTSKKTRLLAGRLAAVFQTSVLTDVSRLWLAGDAILGEHMVYGGAAMRVDKSKGALCIALIGEGVFEPAAADRGSRGEVVPAEFIPPARRATLVDTRQKTEESVDLAAAKRVVGIGRGLAKQEDLQLIEDLAQALGAEVGCSRPISEGLDWMAKQRYIGVSGAMLKPDVYVAVGVSGQVQHMVGVYKSKTIIAVNKDKNAPIFKQADYGIVGDLYVVLPRLIAELKTC